MKKTAHKLALATVGIISLLHAGYAVADGMDEPKKVVKAKPVISPLDKAVNDVELKEPPVAAPAATKIEADEPIVAQAPVAPQNRIAEVQKKNAAFLGLSIGAFDAFRENDRSVAVNAEYQSSVRIAGILQPIYGIGVTTDSGVYAYGGLGAPFHITNKILVTPSLAVAAYHNGAGYDLGQVLNARGAAEVAYVFDNQSRIGITGSVLTNLDSLQDRDMIGTVALTYTTPTALFAGK